MAVWDGVSPSLRQAGHYFPFYHLPDVGTTALAGAGGPWALAVHKESCSRSALLRLLQGLPQRGGCGGSLECVEDREGAVAVINASAYPSPLPDLVDVRYPHCRQLMSVGLWEGTVIEGG